MTILVTGATGNIGRMVVDHLLRRGATAVRALTTDPARAALPPGVEVAEGYLRRLGSLPAAFAGVDTVYLAPTPETVVDVLRLAREAGVRHVVDLSGEPGSWWYEVVEALEESGLEWTHLWPGEFMENATIWVPQIARGEVREPWPEAANAPIAMDDIAAVAATALLATDRHRGRAYTLTGPETLSRAAMVATIAAELGREIPFVRVPRPEAAAILADSMGEYADWYLDGLASLAEEPQQAVDTVREVTGEPATTFAAWVARHRADFDVQPA